MSQLTGKTQEELNIKFSPENPKNYLLVPMSRNGERYRLDFNLVDRTIDRQKWLSLQDAVHETLGSYEDLTHLYANSVMFEASRPHRLLQPHELLPSGLPSCRESAFANMYDLSANLQAKVFGRKAPKDGTELRDWLYLFPSKLASVKELRDSI